MAIARISSHQMYQAIHTDTPVSVFQSRAAAQLSELASGASQEDILKELRTLTQSFALTNRLLAVSYGSESGIADRRSNQSYFIEVGWLSNPLTAAALQTVSLSETPRVTVNLSRIAQLVSPNLGDYDISFTIGVDSFSVTRDIPYLKNPLNANWKSWPLAIRAPALQQSTASRYLTLLTGDVGSALSGQASIRIFGDLPSIIEFDIGFLSAIPTNSDGTLDNNLKPINFTDKWLIDNRDKIPSIVGTVPPEPLWSSSTITSGSIRFYCLPVITPRVRRVDGS